MAKNNKENKRGLGRGLDSLIPKINDSDEDEKSEKSSLTLEDILSEEDTKENPDEKKRKTKEISVKKEAKKKEISSTKKEKKSDKKETKTKEEETPDEKKLEKEKKIEELANEMEEIEKELSIKKENVDIITEEIIEDVVKEDSATKEINKTKEIKSTKEKADKTTEAAKIKENLNDYELTSIEEVKEIIEKNPRITLWSAKSSAVFRYLRKTRPEFSISKEASELIDNAVSEKYPEIWKLFGDL